MATQIGLLSDIHARPGPLEAALGWFARKGVTHILCPGDIAGYGEELEQTVLLLEQSGCEAIMGNHDQWYVEQDEQTPARDYLRRLPRVRTFHFEGVKLYMVHASPPDSIMEGIKLLDEEGEIIPEQREAWSARLADFAYDVLLVGHTHQVFAERLGKPLVINPGSTAFNHSCAILHLPECRVEWHAIGGEEVVRSWNWGQAYRDG